MDIDEAKSLKAESERKILEILREFTEMTGMEVDAVRLTECHQVGAVVPEIIGVSIAAWLVP